MSLPSVFETCEPRGDVLDGTIADADFAADLAKVIRGTAADDYRIPARFFANTHPTRGLKNLLANVLARLTGDSSAAACIFRLDTSYGGGKTHGLIALTHAANGMKGVANVAEFVDPKFVPKTKIHMQRRQRLTFATGVGFFRNSNNAKVRVVARSVTNSNTREDR